ncbi:NAD(P)H-binding protein [Streptomyces spectabilis]|uniref:NmrA family transcriptional regulator n=1 Tax=Streptomyces spectabilis TaxID=68270 RepID=A0A5P2X5W9_STRST|nr:NAD(P)H-binding protein [Streptomyces spectabilis]MBB5101178.1 uncharacterized protein YbjT (DUF2867 family) [Streptomyces spectabilis]MCI3900382.1 NAD(P)H-binding protein [Streptomyces spectabilis]QEV57966.1 NmrA family transcriptional regulator [Streptomyces spectabilis]
MIVITTPTGNIGNQVLHTLLDEAPAHGEELRVVARDPARLTRTVRERVDVVPGSHRDPGVVDRAFAGADAVLWLVPPDTRAPSLESAYTGFTRAAARAFTAHGVRHVVGVSGLGGGTPVAGRAGFVTASLAMDDLIARTGVAYRSLACASFMENLLGEADSLRDEGVFTDTSAAGRKAPLVSTRDIAAVAARLLLDRSWTGTAAVPVLGPEDLSPDDMARVMSETLGRAVRYERRSYDALAAELSGHGVGDAFVQGLVEMKRAKEAGLDDGAPRTPQGASPTTFRAWCELVLRPAVAA